MTADFNPRSPLAVMHPLSGVSTNCSSGSGADVIIGGEQWIKMETSSIS